MATSTAPISHTDIVGVIVALQAAGATVTAERVYQEMRMRQMPCRRSTVQAAVRSWRQQQQAAPMAVGPVAPPPSRPSVSELEALGQEVATAEATKRRLERETQQNESILAQARANYRNALVEAPQLARRYLQAYQARMHPTYLMDSDMPRRLAQLRHELVLLVGEAAVQRLETDPSYRPSWFER